MTAARRKIWIPGEEILAEDLQVLVDQGIIADTAAPGTALTDGMHWADTTNQRVSVYESGAGSWVPAYAWGTAGRVGGNYRVALGTSAAAGTEHVVAWTFEDGDTHGFGAAGGTVITVPAGALGGRYAIDAEALWSGDPGDAMASIRVVSAARGTAVYTSNQPFDTDMRPDSGYDNRIAVSCTPRLEPGDSFAVTLQRGTASTRTYSAYLTFDRIAR